MEENILILQNTLGNELGSQIKDQINSINISEIREEAKRTKKIQDYMQEMDVQKVRDIYSIDILQTDKKENSLKKEDDKREEKLDEQNDEKEKIKLTKTNVADVSIKQAIDLSERANDLHDVKKWLGENIPSRFTKLVVVDSNSMTKMRGADGQSYQRNSTRYDLALLDKEGNIEPLRNYIPQLEQRDASGSNPTSQKYQVDKAGNVEKDAILSEYEIGGKIIQIDNKEMGRVEVNIGKEEHTGNETLGMQLRDSHSTYTIDTDVRRVMGEYEANGVRNVDENLKEIKTHNRQQPNCSKQPTYEDIDGDKNTTSHEHMTEEYIIDEDGKKYTYDQLATRWGKFVDGKPDKQSVKEWLEVKKKENPKKTVKDLIEDGDEEYEDPRIGTKEK
ncbi:MAG: hypothetical protein HFJ34_07970 [Clostridia bacterium]|nr:hypothetical protein [Clostridia bacterium]